MADNTTYLSEYVYDVVVGFGQRIKMKHHDCLNGLFFNWEIIAKVLSVEDNLVILKMNTDWFKDKIKVLWQIMNAAGERVDSSTKEERIEFWNMMSWIGDINWIKSDYETNKLNGTDSLLIILKLTSCLERALGNVYLLEGKQVPFLLKDLLSSDELCLILGKTPVVFMQFLFGCVLGLNIRNVAWHGFLSPSELSLNILMTLLVLTSSVGLILQNIDFQKRPLISESKMIVHTTVLATFSEDLASYYQDFEYAVNNCKYIGEAQRQCWFEVYRLYKVGRFGDSIILLLPKIEQLLRCVYCTVNECDTRMVTAENEALYIILDDILSPTSNSVDNKMKDILGENILEMLLDMFSYQDGPRLRDRLSHGELSFNIINKNLANHVLVIALCAVWKISNPNKVSGIKVGSDSQFCTCRKDRHVCLFKHIEKYCKSYKSMYHPISLVEQDMLKAIIKLSEWDQLPKPDDFTFAQLNLLFNVKTGCIPNNDNFVNFIQGKINCLKIPTIYRPRKELEIVSLLSRIVKSIIEIHERITLNNSTRYLQWCKKTLRERGRANYSKMWQSLPHIQNFLLSTLLLITNVLSRMSSLNEEVSKNYLRYLKLCLQNTENLFSLCHIDKNNWDKMEMLMFKFENTTWNFYRDVIL